MWNLKGNNINELIYKAERESQRTVLVFEKQLPVIEKVEVKTDKPKRGRKPKTK